jgi:hypothetical protein|uniref:Uncharacterized protein n=1 Tax=Myoviridae sp. ctXXl13 TaxID=2827691 RepID=A0A8S5TIX8_9CAUD|nr:MAG TPA: hypothetical protein [Myoviridae sp. ctXXl13]
MINFNKEILFTTTDEFDTDDCSFNLSPGQIVYAVPGENCLYVDKARPVVIIGPYPRNGYYTGYQITSNPRAGGFPINIKGTVSFINVNVTILIKAGINNSYRIGGCVNPRLLEMIRYQINRDLSGYIDIDMENAIDDYYKLLFNTGTKNRRDVVNHYDDYEDNDKEVIENEVIEEPVKPVMVKETVKKSSNKTTNINNTYNRSFIREEFLNGTSPKPFKAVNKFTENEMIQILTDIHSAGSPSKFVEKYGMSSNATLIKMIHVFVPILKDSKTYSVPKYILGLYEKYKNRVGR